MNILLVGIGGFFGSIARYAVSKASVILFGGKFPLGTLFVNVTGSFVLGCIIGAACFRSTADENLKMLIGTGFIGAYTTFSTFSAETILLFQEGRYFSGISNILINLFLSLSAVVLGMWLVKH